MSGWGGYYTVCETTLDESIRKLNIHKISDVRALSVISSMFQRAGQVYKNYNCYDTLKLGF